MRCLSHGRDPPLSECDRSPGPPRCPIRSPPCAWPSCPSVAAPPCGDRTLRGWEIIMERCALGLIGGTVGGGVVDILSRDAQLFRDRCGLTYLKTFVAHTLVVHANRDWLGHGHGSHSGAARRSREIRTVIHLVGGTTAAKDLCIACLKLQQNTSSLLQGPAGRAWRRTFCAGCCSWYDRLRGRGRWWNPHHCCPA
jgi:hypothetical protein